MEYLKLKTIKQLTEQQTINENVNSLILKMKRICIQLDYANKIDYTYIYRDGSLINYIEQQMTIILHKSIITKVSQKNLVTLLKIAEHYMDKHTFNYVLSFINY